MLSAEDTQRLADFAAAGGRVVIGYATGLIDENFHTWLGGYPGAGDGLLREMLVFAARNSTFSARKPKANRPKFV